MKNIICNFKRKLKEDGTVGVFSKTSDPAFIEILGYSGADYVIIDLEHGANTADNIQNLIRAAQVSGIMPIVRVGADFEYAIGRALDVGAGGVQVPSITTKEMAQSVMEHAKFSPAGERGVCRFVRAAYYSAIDRFDYFKEANESIVILQVEGKEGVNNIDDILSVAGIDVLFIGPYDLSQSLGVTGEIDNTIVEAKMLEILNKCAAKGITVGTFADTIENALKWKKLGVKYLAYSVDVGIFHDAVVDIIEDISNKNTERNDLI